MAFIPILDTLPASQRAFWPELKGTPEAFTLYGGTALALRLGHRASVDFDFFSNASFDPDELARTVPYIKDGERVQVEPNTLTCRVDRGGPVLVSFFGGLDLGQVAEREQVADIRLYIASLLDIAGNKAAVVQKRAEAKDYLDIDARCGTEWTCPPCWRREQVVYGRKFNPLITLKTLSYFDDIPKLPKDVRARLTRAVAAVDVTRLPVLTPYSKRPENGIRP
jgi:hypothetical protein